MMYVFALVIALLGWWVSTGVILFLNHLPASTYRWSKFAATKFLLLGLTTIPTFADDVSYFGVLIAFIQGLFIWGWLEMTYLMGFLTGPRKEECPTGVEGWSRFWLALKTSLYHELAVVFLGVLLIYLTFDKPNPVAGYTYATLWGMRWSAKLNLFLGVLNYNSDWLPLGLAYIKSYVRFRRMNFLFPISVCCGAAVAVFFFSAPQSNELDAASLGFLIIGFLIIFAILEHCFLMLPVNDAALWSWAIGTSNKINAVTSHSERADEIEDV
jgi:putative photosynthetic complex assembly protein 2